MAFNWDKLCKAQRDYPKPKFALDAIGRHLKKRPSDPYVLAWKASVLLSQDANTHDILRILLAFGTRQPPITDLSLLSYTYKLLLEATRRADSQYSRTLGTAGDAGLKAWQNAAKSLSTRNARLELWSELFTAAMRQDCWEDVRFAVVQANKDSPASKKVAYYSFILANQLAAEHKARISRSSGTVDMSAQIQFSVALQKMKDAFESSTRLPDQAVRVSDMRDLRFMASIYRRQKRIVELFELWSAPPMALKKLFEDHAMDILILQVDLAREGEQWALLANFCATIITREMKSTGNISPICSVAWSVWSGFLNAVPHLYPTHEVEARFLTIYNAFQKKTVGTGTQSREVQLTRLALAGYCRQPILPLLKQFWLDNFSRRTCFFDLRRFVALLPKEELKEFHSFVSENARSRTPDTSSETTIREWLLAESSVLQFEYLVFVSMHDDPEDQMVEALAATSLRLYHVAADTQNEVASDIACVAVMSLLRLHLLRIEGEFSTRPQLQAAMLLRHLLGNETLRNARQLALLSTRVHLNLGLGTIAFEHYGYAKIKEMLNDTASWVLLSRISQAHPFDVKGPRGFSADDELRKVISSIDKMESRLGDFLYKDLQDFGYDTALDLLEFKRKERSSLTKHACMIERRRIARLKGNIVDRQLDLDMKDYADISVNYDFTALPDFEFVEKLKGLTLFIDPTPVTPMWVASYHYYWDLPSRLIYKERIPFAFRETMTQILYEEMSIPDIKGRTGKEKRSEYLSHTEESYDKVFRSLGTLAAEVYDMQPRFDLTPPSIDQAFSSICESIDLFYQAYRFFIDDGHLDEPAGKRFCSERDLMYSYGLLEVLLLLARFIPALRDITRQKSHRLYSKISKSNVEKLYQKTQDCYRIIMAMAQCDIDRIKRTGMNRIREEVREGTTGEALRAILSDKDVELYAKEYVESAIEAYSGILKVKLN